MTESSNIQYDPDAEAAVLGAMLLEREAIAIAIERLAIGDFYVGAHAVLYEALIDLYDVGLPVDPVTLSEELRKREKLEEIGGLPFVYSIAGAIPTAANIEAHAEIVKEKSLLRQLQAVGDLIKTETTGMVDDPGKLLDSIEAELLAIRSSKTKAETVRIGTMIRENSEKLEERLKTGAQVDGLDTGFCDLDRILGGLYPQNLCVLAGSTSHGKTAMALSIALMSKVPALFFSLEMSKEEIYQRIQSMISGIPVWKIRQAKLTEAEFMRLTQDESRLFGLPVWINDKAAISLLELRAVARRYKQREDLKLVIVDYLQLVRAKRAENRQIEVTEISRGLKSLAKELNIPIIALSQLNRSVDHQSDKRPVLSSLRESGNIENDADQVIFVYRPGKAGEKVLAYDESIGVPLSEATLIVAKNRHGATGEAELYFDSETTMFRNIPQPGREQ